MLLPESIYAINNLDANRCFLCGAELTDENRSDEHIFPVWLQHKVGLWNQRLVLINGTSIPYRKLVIPCCKPCNTGVLAKLEDDISTAFEDGYAGISALSPLRVYQWCNKIYYALLFKELSLQVDQAHPDLGSILNPEGLEGLHTHHLFLQSVRFAWQFEGFLPASILIVKTHTYDDVRENFDFLDLFLTVNGDKTTLAPFFAIRFGEVGIVCAFDDLGMQKKHLFDDIGIAPGQPLHPFQFIEVASLVAYKHSLRLTGSKYVTSGDGVQYLTRLSESMLVLPSYWDDWDNDRFMTMFKGYLSRGTDELPQWVIDCPKGQLCTALRKTDGSPLLMDRDGNEAKPSDT